MEPNEIRLAKLQGLAKAEQDKQKAIADAKHTEFENWREWLKAFILRVPTLCEYCELLRMANIKIPVVSRETSFRPVTLTYARYSFGRGVAFDNPNTGGCGSRHDMIGPDMSWVRSENGIKGAFDNGGEYERDFVRFATMASEWEKQLLALIDKL